MSPRSRSRSLIPRRSYSKSSGRNERYSHDSKSSSRSISLRHHRRHVTRSRSRTRSPSTSRSRTPHDKRRGTKEKPIQSRCIGVFGLSVYTTQQKIREIFSKFGPIERIQVVIDAQTGRSRGFCFIYYEDIADAKIAKDECCGLEIDGRRIRVDYSITQRPHTPTPGYYMGKRIRNREREYSDRHRERERHRDRERERTTSPYGRGSRHHTERHRRSTSRSYTPR